MITDVGTLFASLDHCRHLPIICHCQYFVWFFGHQWKQRGGYCLLLIYTCCDKGRYLTLKVRVLFSNSVGSAAFVRCAAISHLAPDVTAPVKNSISNALINHSNAPPVVISLSPRTAFQIGKQMRGSNRSLFDFSIDFPMVLAKRAASRSPPRSKTYQCTPSIADVLVVCNDTDYGTESGWFWSLSSLSPVSHTIGLAPQMSIPICPLPLTSSRRPLPEVSNKIASAIDESLSK